ncbi:thiamine-phosphate kinase [Psychrobacter sp. I-STPA10]|uniref:thiamine-phosphate kinase n=1 Tax=Psychrobacter sp. I-STPA10 TaxID=2585769 RepID=UPI001E40357C|nr:thiamine-phosphate kinase [Psychrobacter sp. I-STPA10]
MTEFELIYQIFAEQQASTDGSLAQAVHIDKGIGDDAAVISISQNSKLVSCVDTMVQGRHFSDDWQTVEELAFAIGYKSVAVNLSDLAAMGATPHHILLALALPKRLANKAWLTEFAKGLFHACQQYNVQLIGGDTTRHDKLVISITAQGFLPQASAPIYRDGAKVGDKIYVSGTLGDANYALTHPDTAIGQQLAHRLHMPTPRVALGQALAQQGKATAMIDISDGLVQDLGHICQQSGVSMRVNLENLPCSQAVANIENLSVKKTPLAERLLCQLTGGDDYELAFTLPANIDISSIANLQQINNTLITCIGKVIATTDSYHQPILFYNNQPITANNPYPFDQLPNLHGFQHF